MTRKDRLIERYLTGRLTPAETAELRAWLKADLLHRKAFVIETYLNRAIYEYLRSEPAPDMASGSEGVKQHALSDSGVLSHDHLTPDHSAHRLHQCEDTAIGDILTHMETPKEKRRAIEEYARKQLDAFLAENRPKEPLSATRRSRATALATRLQGLPTMLDRLVSIFVRGLMACALLLVLSLTAISIYHYVLSQRVTAIMGDSIHAEWLEPPLHPQLKRGELTLTAGAARLTFMKGAELLMQAPCRIHLQSAQRLYLHEGNVTAIVPPSAKGFAIETDYSTIVDHGTEFGVSVDRNSRAEVHVYKGKVSLENDSQNPLVENQAAVIDTSGQITIESLSNRFSPFLRRLPDANQLGVPGRCIDLGDILGGENGFGSEQPDSYGPGDAISQSLNPLTGSMNDPRRLTRDFYVYSASNSLKSGMRLDVLDGTWNHQNDSDQWDGSAIGEGNPGGVSVLSEQTATFIRFQDTGDPAPDDPGSDRNQKLYLGHRLDFGLDGAVLEFRTRLACTGPLDPLHDSDNGKSEPWPADGIGTVIGYGGKGMFTIAEGGRGPISFSLATQHELISLPGYEDLQSDALVINNLAGNQPSLKVDTEQTDPEVKARNWLPVADITQWNTFRICISEGGRGTHRVAVSVNGQPYREFEVTVGPPSGYYQDSSYVAMGCPFTFDSCAFDVEYLSVCSRWEEQRDLPREQWEGDLLAATHPADGHGRHQPVADSPYIDGVFVPDTDHGPCIVSSEGHIFADCPDTDGTFTYNIMHRRAPGVVGATDRGGIVMHANTGVTFDMQAMLNTMPHTRCASFTATACMLNDSKTGLGEADIWVLVDGRTRHSGTLVYNGQPQRLEIPLDSEDRFLTLIVTDGRRSQTGYRPSVSDVCYFSEPVLRLESMHADENDGSIPGGVARDSAAAKASRVWPWVMPPGDIDASGDLIAVGGNVTIEQRYNGLMKGALYPYVKE